MAQEPKSSLVTPDPYYIPGYGGFCPQLRYQLGSTYGTSTNRLLTDPYVMNSSRPLLSPLRQPPAQTTAEPPKLQRSRVDIYPKDDGIVLPKMYIPPGYAGHRPMSQFQHATSFSRMVVDAVDDFLEVQSIMRRQIKRPAETTNNGGTKNANIMRHWKPTAEYKSPLTTYIKPLKIDLPRSLQRNAIPGYTGFIPRYQWSMGVGFAPGVKASMDEFDRSQIQIRDPLTSSERRLKPTYWPKARIYSPAGLLPKYTGFVPGFRDTSGSTFGDTTRQLYIKSPL
ncbi:ciliary microtubule inner protein 2A isoform X2 [Rhinoderma darwinii]|uniref:ciliary microtubule inner protein 2A isoform X2 n=1 Tax=Rhinoderma darwinii TaxID=43563 RepID=UPI003F670B5C